MSDRTALAGLLVIAVAICAWSWQPAAAWAADDETPAAEDATDAGGHSEAEHGEAAAGHEGGAHPAGDPNPMATDPDLAIFTAVIFFVTLAVLWKFAWGPITEALQRREEMIAGNIAAAQAQNDQAKQLLGRYEKRLSGAADEVRGLLDEARRDAEHTKAEILAEAKAAAQAEHDRALREVSNAKDAALKEIGEAGADFAVNLAAKIVEKELSPDDHNRLIRDAVSKFPSDN